MSAQRSGGDHIFEPATRLVRVALGLIVIVGLAGSLLLAWTLSSREQDRLRASFELQATRAIADVRAGLLRLEAPLLSLRAFFDSSQVVELEEFRIFTRHALEHDDALRALLWIAGDDELRYAVGPEEGSDRLRGELLARSEVRELLQRSAGTRTVAASVPLVDLVPGAMPRLLLALQVFDEGRRTGFVAGLIDVERVLAGTGLEDAGWGFLIADIGAEADEVRAEPVRYAGIVSTTDLARSETVDRWGRRWELRATAPESAFADVLTGWPEAALANGLILVALMVGLVALATNRRRLRWLVERRTKDIQAAYDTLAEESERRIEFMMEARTLERQLREIVDLVPFQVYVKDWYGRYLLANAETARSLGTTVRELTASANVDLQHDLLEQDAGLLEERELMQRGLSSVRKAVPFHDAGGRRRLLREIKAPFHGLPGKQKALLCVAIDVTEQHHVTMTLAAQTRLLEELAQGASPIEVLHGVVGAAEEIVPGMRASILLVTPDGKHLSHCFAPSLPEVYNQAVDGLDIGPMTGSCGAAAHSRELVVVDDVSTHPNWEPYRELAARAGIRACWSQPILTAEGVVLGTFAMYYDEVRRPEAYELDFMRAMAHLALVALERQRS